MNTLTNQRDERQEGLLRAIDVLSRSMDILNRTGLDKEAKTVSEKILELISKNK